MTRREDVDGTRYPRDKRMAETRDEEQRPQPPAINVAAIEALSGEVWRGLVEDHGEHTLACVVRDGDDYRPLFYYRKWRTPADRYGHRIMAAWARHERGLRETAERERNEATEHLEEVHSILGAVGQETARGVASRTKVVLDCERARADEKSRKLDILAAELKHAQATVYDQAAALSLVATDTDDVWLWQGDGNDHPESMVNGSPVVMRADTLREILARVAKAEQERNKSARVAERVGCRLLRSLRRQYTRAEKVEQELADAQAEVERLREAVRTLLLATVGRCFHGAGLGPEVGPHDDDDRCTEPAVYGIMTGYACVAHRTDKHPRLIAPATPEMLALLGKDPSPDPDATDERR